MTTLYHNPRCSKSRQALHLLEEKGETLEVVRYLENPPSVLELKQIAELMQAKPIDLVRTQEKEWKENYRGKSLSDDEILEILHAHPRLLQRPIAVHGTHAVIARPPEKVLELL